MDLIAALAGLHASPFARTVGGSVWMFPALDAAHILFQGAMVGIIALLDLRLMGLWAMSRRAGETARRLLPFAWTAFAGAAVTGAGLFVVNADKFVDNRAFLIKSALMVLAGLNMLAFHLGPYRRVAEWDLSPPPLSARAAGAASLALWIGVVFFGRYIWYPGN